jgi:hypothetical protein
MTFNLPVQLNDRLLAPIRKEIEETRSETVRAIASSDTGRQILTELVKPDLYAPKGSKDVLLRLYRDPNGLFLGHAHGPNGRIIGHARWLKVTSTSSRLVASAGMLTGHLMLVQISQKLDHLQGSVDAIRRAIDDDRMQRLRAAISGVRDAIEAKSDHNRQFLLTSTIPHLNEAVLQTIAALKREIAEIPLPHDWQIARVIIDREPRMRELLSKAEKTLHACVEGISVLGQAYIALNELALGYQTMIRGLEELGQVGIADAEFRARLIRPSEVGDRPELIWWTFRQQLPELRHLVEIERDRQVDDPVEIEMSLKPSQITAALDHQLATAG